MQPFIKYKYLKARGEVTLFPVLFTNGYMIKLEKYSSINLNIEYSVTGQQN